MEWPLILKPLLMWKKTVWYSHGFHEACGEEAQNCEDIEESV